MKKYTQAALIIISILIIGLSNLYYVSKITNSYFYLVNISGKHRMLLQKLIKDHVVMNDSDHQSMVLTSKTYRDSLISGHFHTLSIGVPLF